ncbi:MAG: TatD family hydrolase [Candidatus Woesearchaeota archaeon]|jgi:TatD DNase family protein|nr:TatD family hydrolase [Candidatus Woesearchaeota archaeon]MDP7323301.1 TatD family hydrolase [Candidatus Woesearchaeota archaeon]MDP7457664.1 TatD family hydrolase [Candidatus Woesearchaeota archaeon]
MTEKLFVDAHCHLDYPILAKDLDRVISRAKEAGVVKIITNGIDFKSNRLSLEYAKKYDIVEAALGIYPPKQLKQECKELGVKWKDFDVDEEIAWIKKQNPIAIGEIGMDFVGDVDKEGQEVIFRKMINLAKELGKYIIVHSRKAEREVIDVIEDEKISKVIMHCFSGKKKLVERIKNNNWFVTIPTCVVRGEQYQSLARTIDINHMLCETDAPFLSPFKDKQNEPSFVVEAYKKIAKIKGMTLEEVEKNIYMNYQQIF